MVGAKTKSCCQWRIRSHDHPQQADASQRRTTQLVPDDTCEAVGRMRQRMQSRQTKLAPPSYA